MSLRNPVTLILAYLILVLILCIALSSCTTSKVQNRCEDFTMNVQYVDVYLKSVNDENLRVIKYRCIPKKSGL